MNMVVLALCINGCTLQILEDKCVDSFQTDRIWINNDKSQKYCTIQKNNIIAMDNINREERNMHFCGQKQHQFT